MNNENMVVAFQGALSSEEGTKQLTEWRIKIQNFTEKLNVPPGSENVRSRGGNNYLPISHIENALDELFFGQWSTCDFSFQQIANEIVGQITVEVLHPVSGVWIKRTGCAGVQIMQDKDSPIDSIVRTKKKNALETGFPKLKSMCIKNACLSIGKHFGRDLSRKSNDVATYNKLPLNTGNWEDVMNILNDYKGEDREQYRLDALHKRANNKMTAEYVSDLREKLGSVK